MRRTDHELGITRVVTDEYSAEVTERANRSEVSFGLRFGMNVDSATREAADKQHYIDRARLREIAQIRKGREDAAKLAKLTKAVEQVKDICARAGYVPMPGDDMVSMRAVDGAQIHRILVEAQK